MACLTCGLSRHVWHHCMRCWHLVTAPLACGSRELGAELASPTSAPAGTKRLSRLLHAAGWTAHLSERFLWQQAHQPLSALEQAGEAARLLWDASVIEQPERMALEGLCALPSSKARRGVSHQAGLLPSARRPAHLRARYALAGGAAAGAARASYLSRDAALGPHAESSRRQRVRWNPSCWTKAWRPGGVGSCTFLTVDVQAARGS